MGRRQPACGSGREGFSRSIEDFAHEVLYGIEQDETHLSSPYPQALHADGQGQRDTGAAASELRPLRWRRELREPERKSRSADIFKCKTL